MPEVVFPQSRGEQQRALIRKAAHAVGVPPEEAHPLYELARLAFDRTRVPLEVRVDCLKTIVRYSGQSLRSVSEL